MNESPLSPTLFDLLDQYVAELPSLNISKKRRLTANSKLLTFCQNFFNQFFDNCLDHQITGFSAISKRSVVRLRLRRKAELSREMRSLMTLYEEFCDLYVDLIGAGYGGGTKSTVEAVHTKFLPRLLERARQIPSVQEALLERIRQTETGYLAAIGTLSW